MKVKIDFRSVISGRDYYKDILELTKEEYQHLLSLLEKNNILSLISSNGDTVIIKERLLAESIINISVIED